MAKGGVEAWRVFGTLGLKGLGKTTGQLRAFNATGAAVGKNVAGLNKKMLLLAGGTAAVGGALAIMGGKALKHFANFDEAMTESLAIMGDVSEAMEGEMVDAARQVARETLFSAEQAAESYFFLASAGLDAKQSIAALPQVAKFAQAGMFDMARATDLATDAQSALGLTVDDAGQNLQNLTRVTDVLVKANTLANATVEQFSTALTSQAGAAAKAFGVDMEQTVAVLAAYADQGLKAEKAGSSFARMLRLLIPAANQNADVFEDLNIEVFDTEGNLNNLADIIGDLERALDGMGTSQRAATLDMLGFKKRSQQVILPLLGVSEGIREYEDALGDAQGITGEVADKQLQTLNKQLGILAGELGDVALGFGSFLSEAIDAPGKVNALIEKIRELTRAYRIFNFERNKALREADARARGEVADGRLPSPSLNPDDPAAFLFQQGGLNPPPPPADTEDDGTGGSGGLGLNAIRPRTLTPEELGLDEMLPGMEGMNLQVIQEAADETIAEFTARMEQRWGQSFSEWTTIRDPNIEREVKDNVLDPLEEGSDGAAAELLPRFEQMGADLIRGLVDGSFDMKEFLKNSMITLASNWLLGPLGGILGIASPSKKTAEMGRQMVEGLAVGIEEAGRSGVVARAWGGVIDGLPSMADAAGHVRPGMTIDVSGMPPARNPLAASRDAEWQEFFRDSARAARGDGARL